MLSTGKTGKPEGLFQMPDFHNDPVKVSTDSTDAAISATNDNSTKQAGYAVYGKSAAAAVVGDSSTWHGIVGFTSSTSGGSGVYGSGRDGGPGIIGTSKGWIGVFGETFASKNGPAGVWGDGHEGASGVKGHTSCPGAYGVAGFHMTNQGPGIYGKGAPAARFDGDVEVNGSVRVTDDVVLMSGMADLAEEFTVIGDEPVTPGAVMVIAGNDSVRISDAPYDRRVAGVVSGAGSYRPALVLDRRSEDTERHALALTGKVWVLADADHGAIEVGDLLTTSATPAHAMRAANASKALGTIIGKALDPLPTGKALIRALVALQ